MNGVAVGAVFAFLAVALGAFGAHGLKNRLDTDKLTTYETGASYQMYHGLALVGVGVWSKFTTPTTSMVLAEWFFVIGIVLFSGSLYLLAVSGNRKLGAITPLGGVCFLIGWACVFIGALS